MVLLSYLYARKRESRVALHTMGQGRNKSRVNASLDVLSQNMLSVDRKIARRDGRRL